MQNNVKEKYVCLPLSKPSDSLQNSVCMMQRGHKTHAHENNKKHTVNQLQEVQKQVEPNLFNNISSAVKKQGKQTGLRFEFYCYYYMYDTRCSVSVDYNSENDNAHIPTIYKCK